MNRTLALLCTLLFGAAAAACHEELGVGDQPEGARLEIADLTLIGVEQLDESRVTSAMRTDAGSWLPWAEPEFFDRKRFEEDIDRIAALYRQEGFPDAEVTSVDLNVDPAAGTVSPSITISEGAPILVSAVELDGLGDLPADAVQAIRDTLPLSEGSRLTLSAEAQAITRVAQELQNRGYPDPNVSTERIEEAPKRVRVIVRVRPGPTAVFGPVEIVGNSEVDENVVRRQLTFEPGDPYSRLDLTNSRRRIASLNLFQFVSVDVLDDQPDAARLATRVTVAETEPRELHFSFGYGTEEQLGAEATWEHLNFFGGARTAGVRGKWSSLDRGAEVHITQPYLFHPNLSLSLRGRNWYANEPAFRAVSRGGRGSILWAPASTFSATMSFINEFERSTVSAEALADPSLRDELIALGLDPTTGVQDGTLAALAMDLERRTTTDVLNPREGYVVSTTLEQAGGWLPGSFNYYNVAGEARAYQPIGEQVTLAGRVRAASIGPMGAPSDVPFFKRYFLGGSTSLRGWGRFEVGPLSELGLPIGGNSLFEASSEVRFPITGKLRGVVFVDAGNVWRNAWDMNLGDLLWDAGPGLRYETPFGPIRFDVAYQLKQLEGLHIDGTPQTRRWRMHFSIGQAF
jgi:outer membrane protein assembly complex protein YaeT